MKRFFFCLAAFFCVFSASQNMVWAQETPEVIKDIPYIQGSTNPKQMLDLYIPRTGTKHRPVLVFVHGGGWGLGDKKMARKMGPFFTGRGVILVSLNYRLAPANPYPDFAEDIAAAMRWVVDHIGEYGGDVKNIVLSGHSAGAHLVALIGTHPDFLREQGLDLRMFRAVVPVDTASFDLSTDPYGLAVRRQKKMRTRAFGSEQEILDDASPSKQALKARSKRLSQFEIFVSSRRPDAVEQSRELTQAVQKSGNKAEMHVVQGLSHRAMCMAIYDPDSEISQTILKRLGVQ